jgi:1-acyl-sn-glycerol-3-phosphate acyltransferase
MLLVRSVVSFVFMVVWTIAIGILFLPMMLLPSRWIIPFLQIWGRGLIVGAQVFCGIRWQVTGLENIPKTPCIIACKHQSAWETVFLPLLLSNYAYVLKRELLWLPFVGWYMMKSRMIAVNRKGKGAALKQMLNAAEDRLAHGQSIIIFPEGTRTAPGADVPYHFGVAALYSRFGDRIPVIPIALNSGLVWPRNSFIKKPGLVTVEVLPAIPKDTDKKVFLDLLKTTIDTASNRLLETKPG